MTSKLISQTSLVVLLVAGAALLFTPDSILPYLIPGYPEEGLWLGQLLGAAWLAFAVLNRLSRSAVLGGIYGRPVVMANAALHFISALVLLKAAQRVGFPLLLSLVALPAAVLAVAYGVLLFKGPLEKDLAPPAG